MNGKWKSNRITPLLLFLLAAVCLLTVVLGSNQASLSIPIPQTFSGEYSRDGEVWYPLDDGADLDALDSDLFLRGHFRYDVDKDGRLYYYQNHIGVTICLNGELLFLDTISEYEHRGLALQPSMCGSRWNYIVPPASPLPTRWSSACTTPTATATAAHTGIFWTRSITRPTPPTYWNPT